MVDGVDSFARPPAKGDPAPEPAAGSPWPDQALAGDAGIGLSALLTGEFRTFLLEPWRRQPSQPRALRTVEALMLTAERMFREQGLAGLGLEQVARAAHVTPQA